MATPKLQLLSKTLYDTDGTTTVWDFNFSGGYILTDHIKAYTETPAGIRTTITVTPAMLIGAWQLQITPALAAGDVLTIYRSTPKDQPMVDFVDRGQVSEVALDTVARQAIFVAAEASDDVATSNIDVAVAAANSADAAKTAAQASATAAAGSASAAATSAGNASTSAGQAASSAADAVTTVASLSNLTGSTVTGRAVLKAPDATSARAAITAAASGTNGDITSLIALAAGGLPDNSVLTADIANGAITPAKLSGGQSGSAPALALRAWCIFNGEITGTNAPTAGSNVASVTRNGIGDYTVNFTTPMPSANYGASVTGRRSGFSLAYAPQYESGSDATKLKMLVFQTVNGASVDATYVVVMIVG